MGTLLFKRILNVATRASDLHHHSNWVSTSCVTCTSRQVEESDTIPKTHNLNVYLAIPRCYVRNLKRPVRSCFGFRYDVRFPFSPELDRGIGNSRTMSISDLAANVTHPKFRSYNAFGGGRCGRQENQDDDERDVLTSPFHPFHSSIIFVNSLNR